MRIIRITTFALVFYNFFFYSAPAPCEFSTISQIEERTIHKSNNTSQKKHSDTHTTKRTHTVFTQYYTLSLVIYDSILFLFSYNLFYFKKISTPPLIFLSEKELLYLLTELINKGPLKIPYL